MTDLCDVDYSKNVWLLFKINYAFMQNLDFKYSEKKQ